jgi:hypothetical protein
MWWLWDVVKMGDGGRGGRRQRRTMPGILRLGRREEVSSVDNSAHKPTKSQRRSRGEEPRKEERETEELAIVSSRESKSIL